jgi:multidrug efflux system membrane fusion protein
MKMLTKAFRIHFRGGLFCLLGGTLFLSGCDKLPEQARAPIPVRVGKAEPAAQSNSISYTGAVRARWQTDLGFRVGGKIIERVVEVGQRVQSGQVLARLDPADYEAQVRSAEAELSAARANLVQARADLTRTEMLVRQGWATSQLLDSRRSAADQGEGRLDGAEAKLKLARDSVGYTELRANADGVITAIPTEVGQVVQIGQTVMSLARTAELEAVVPIPEGQTDAISVATPSVTLWSATGGGRSYNARLREISPAADLTTRTYSARYSILNPDDAVQLGSTATVLLALPTLPGADGQVSVPATALFQSENGPAVWRFDEGRIQLTPVQIVRYGQERVVLSGLPIGADVVTAGVHKLNPSLQVRIAEAKP